MKIDELDVDSVVNTTTKKENSTKVVHKTVFKNEDYKVTIESKNPLGFAESSKGLSVEINNTQKTLDIIPPENNNKDIDIKIDEIEEIEDIKE